MFNWTRAQQLHVTKPGKHDGSVTFLISEYFEHHICLLLENLICHEIIF